MSQKTKILIGATITIILGLGIGMLYEQTVSRLTRLAADTEPRLAENQENPKISIMIDFEDGKVKTINDIELNKGANLLDIMKSALAAENIPFEYKEYAGLGALVTKIGDKSNGTGTSYWQYWVNNKMPPIGASSYQPRAGDIVEWKFLPDQGF